MTPNARFIIAVTSAILSITLAIANEVYSGDTWITLILLSATSGFIVLSFLYYEKGEEITH